MGRTPCGLLTLAFGLLFGLGACGTTQISGTVVDGRIGRVMLVDMEDARLTENGLGGVGVDLHQSVRSRAGRMARIAGGVSDDTGRFEIEIPRGAAAAGSIRVRAHGPGIYGTETKVYWPGIGEELLVIVRSKASPPGGS